MSSLFISENAHLMMMELMIDKISISDNSHVNTIKEITIKFQILDNNWMMFNSQYRDDTLSDGTSTGERIFSEGKSVLFAISESDFKQKISKTAIEIHVFREASDCTAMKPYYGIASIRIPINSLFNEIIQQVMKQKTPKQHFDSVDERTVISRSLKKTFAIRDKSTSDSPILISACARLSYFGKSIITEVERLWHSEYRVREGTCEGQSYHCHEVSRRESETGFWGVENDQLSANSRNRISVHDTNIRSNDQGIMQVIDTQKEHTTDPAIENRGNGNEKFLDDNIVNHIIGRRERNSPRARKKNTKRDRVSKIKRQG